MSENNTGVVLSPEQVEQARQMRAIGREGLLQFCDTVDALRAEVERLKKAAIRLLNNSPLGGDLRLLMLSMTAQALSDDNQAYVDEYAQARRELTALVMPNQSVDKQEQPK